MIRINLLPVRAAKKKETAYQQIAIFCFSIVLVLLICGVLWFIQYLQIGNTRKDIASANIKISELKKKIGKLEELKGLKEQVRKKLNVLDQLRKNKTGPAQRLAALSDNTPDQLWLTAYSESGTDIKLSGLAVNEELIASFMKNLEKSADFMSVELLVSEQSVLSGAKLKRFDVTCKQRPSTALSPLPAVAPTAAK